MIDTASPGEKQGVTRLLRFLANWEPWASSVANRLAAILIRFRYVILALLTIAYFAATCLLASRKLFWFDEIFTIYLSRLPDLSSLWDALKSGVDFNPPMLYLLTRFAHKLAGEGPIGTRLPEMIGFWIFCLCLYRFVSARSSPLGGIISFLLPMITIGYFYAYDARPYGIMLGFSGLALVCWQAAADRTSGRFLWLAGLTAALAGALLSHAYGLLLLIPLAAGEMARGTSVRRVDWPVWTALAASCFAELALVPIARSSHPILATSIYLKATLHLLLPVYMQYLKPLSYVLFGWLALMALSKESAHARVKSVRSLPTHEVVTLLAFLILPAVQVLAAKVTAGPAIARYSIVWLAGPACLLGFFSASRPLVATGTLAIMLAQFGVRSSELAGSLTLNEPSGFVLSTSMQDYRGRYQWMDAAGDKTSPILLLDVLDFLPTLFYAPPNLFSRLTYVIPSGGDVIGTYYVGLQKCCGHGLHAAVPVSDFLAAHHRFLAYGGVSTLSRLDEFAKDGATVTLARIDERHFLAHVSFPKK